MPQCSALSLLGHILISDSRKCHPLVESNPHVEGERDYKRILARKRMIGRILEDERSKTCRSIVQSVSLDSNVASHLNIIDESSQNIELGHDRNNAWPR